MCDDRRALGAQGEAEAAAHLASRGYRIVARNVRAGGVELDLVALRAGVVVFVEVKTRRSRRAGPPEDAVDARKRARLVRGAGAWLAETRRRGRSGAGPRLPAGLRVRFDVITCEPAGGGWRVRHWPGAFDAGG